MGLPPKPFLSTSLLLLRQTGPSADIRRVIYADDPLGLEYGTLLAIWQSDV